MLLRGPLTTNSNNISNSLVVVLHLHNSQEHLDNPKEIVVRIYIYIYIYFKKIELDAVTVSFWLAGSVPVNPQTGQPDYTAQWIQYYRSIGAMKDAEVLEQQLKGNKVNYVVQCSSDVSSTGLSMEKR